MNRLIQSGAFVLAGSAALFGDAPAGAQSSVSLATAVNYATGVNPHFVVTGDFNGDAALDLATANLASGTVSVLLGNGDGTFFQLALNSSVTCCIASGGIGCDDATCTNAVCSIDVYCCEVAWDEICAGEANSLCAACGGGGASDGSGYAVGVHPYTVSAADVNGDAKLDLVTANAGSGTVSVLLGNGDGTFQTAIHYAAGTAPTAAVIADFNSDGAPDLATSIYPNNYMTVLAGNGDGTFQAAAIHALNSFSNALAAGDLNADAKPDLAVPLYASAEVAIVITNGDGTLQAPVNYAIDAWPFGVTIADVNDDGRSDVLVTHHDGSGGPSTLSVLMGNAAGTLEAPMSFAAGPAAYMAIPADFNGDATIDLAVPNADSGPNFSILAGNGDGTFGPPIQYSAGDTPIALAAGDFNGDGRPDVAVANYGGQSVAILLNTTDFGQPPDADAGADFSVNEGSSVTLDGTLSADPNGDALSYSWTQLPGGPSVSLSSAGTATPSFTAPTVAFAGETLSFQLTVTANSQSAMDTVSVSIVNVNHAPVALAGDEQTVAEGAAVTLHGEDSFDIDGDVFAYHWVQLAGPTVVLSDDGAVNPAFVAPWVSASGASLVFMLSVDDGFFPDAAAAPYTLANVVDCVTINVTNVNGMPLGNAGPDQVVNELTTATLNGSASSDPDSDTLSFSWEQVAGPSVALSGASTASPTFQAPSVSASGATLVFRLTVDDGFGGSGNDTVVIEVRDVGQPPMVTFARPTIELLWPPNHHFVEVGIEGVSSTSGAVTITITSVTQDEPTNGLGDGDTAIDAVINANGTVLLRAERSGNGNGRVYHIHFNATNSAGSATGMVKVSVPHSKKSVAVDGGELFISTQ